MSRRYPYRCRLARSSCILRSRPVPSMVLASASLAARNARGSSASPGRSPNHAAEIAAPESRVLFREHVGLDVAECRVGLVFDAIVERLDNVFLELIGARMRVHDAERAAVVHAHLDACRHQS